MLSRHPGKCRGPHGHSRTIDIVMEADELSEDGMVIDFAELKQAARQVMETYDHTLCVNSADQRHAELKEIFGDALVSFPDQEPTTETLARRVFDEIAGRLAGGRKRASSNAPRLVRVRVSETSSTWAEYEA